MPASPFSFAYRSALLDQSPQGDNAYFALALKNARFCMGSTHPNPSVGAVIVKDGHILAQGFTEAAGGMHAEKMAIHRAPKDLVGATLYVSLEPCSHHGRTPPCTHAVINAGISRVVYGVEDPNPLVAGSGLRALRQAGLAVEQIAQADLQEQAQHHIRPFKKYILEHKPYVVLKVATSADNRAAVKGQRTKISGLAADQAVHRLRRAVDAVMVGANTVRIDNPHLTARLAERNHGTEPIRIVLSTDLNLPLDAHVFDTSEADTWVLTTTGANPPLREQLRLRQLSIIDCPSSHGLLDVGQALRLLAERGLTSVLIEAGPTLLRSIIAEQLADEIWWFTAPHALGARGLAAGFAPGDLAARGYSLGDECMLGEDRLGLWEKNPA